MSRRHDEAFGTIRAEHDTVVAALKQGQTGKKRGSPGLPGYDPLRLGAAISTAGDAYALLLISTAEAFLREYLTSIGVSLSDEPKLSMLIDKSVKELNRRSTGVVLRPEEKVPMHDLRAMRNSYAHGHARTIFPSVPRVEVTLSRFMSPFP